VRRWLDAFGRRGDVVGMNRRNVELVYALNERRHYPLADDKILAKELLSAAGVAVPRTLLTCDGLYDLPRAMRLIEGLQDFVVKPSRGGGGNGISVVTKRLGPGLWRGAGGRVIDADELHYQMAQILFGAFARGALNDRVLVEPRIVAHEAYQGLWADGLCDVRIITVHAKPLLAMVRVPTAQSDGKANLHQGGLGLAVELDTGLVVRAVCRGESLTHHPDSGGPLLGLRLPHWEQTVDVARRAASAVPLQYLGVDIVVDEREGPLVLEINARPGLEIQNVHGVGLNPLLEALS